MSSRSKTWLLLPMIAAAACTKTNTQPGAASLTIVNAMSGIPAIEYSEIPSNRILYYNTGLTYTTNSGELVFRPHRRDDLGATVKPPLYDVTLKLPIGTISSLFLTGTLESRDTMLVKDELAPLEKKDSSMAIRFVNLSPGSAPISINLQDSPNGSEVSSLGFKGHTPFKVYKANRSAGNYIFEFRDAATGTLLTSYTMANIGNPGSDNAPNLWRNKNMTLVFDGLPGDPNWPQTVFLVNNF